MIREQNVSIQSALSVEYKVDFSNSNGKRKAKKPPASLKNTSRKPPRVTKLLTLAHHLQELINQGIVANYADIARLSGLSRARVTQIINLTLLAPQIQEEIISQVREDFLSSIGEQNLRVILKTPVWKEQIQIWRKFVAKAHCS